MDSIDHWKISLRRQKPCVEGYLRSGPMIHCYISWISPDCNEVVCAETGRRYRLSSWSKNDDDPK